VLKGIAASPGVNLGRAFLVRTMIPGDFREEIGKDEVEREIHRYRSALETASQELLRLQEDAERRLGKDKAAIFGAQRMMLEDPTLDEAVQSKIRDGLASAEKACTEACEEQAVILEGLGDQYLAARALDLRDIAKRLVRCLSGVSGRTIPADLPSGTVVVADDLAPSDTVLLDAGTVTGIVLDKGGRTSHTAILARSLGIPAVVGTGIATLSIRDADLVAVDGQRGEVTVNPDAEEEKRLRERAEAFLEEKKRLAALRDLPCITRDGRRIELSANIGNVPDVPLVINAGADGVGLFRTEFLFIDREDMPGEEEQFQAYKEVLSSLSPRPVVGRTLDAGGDKNIPYLNLRKEENPFLGLRAIRLCLKEKDIFRKQLRALLRASAYGKLRIMFPMISNVQELREAKREVQAVRAELEKGGIAVAADIQVGIMVEIPSAAIDADILAPECDFFSIGTNDLVQYTVAVDRGNPDVAYLSDPFHPAVLRLINRTIEEGHKRGIWVGMCGEMAGMPLAIPVLVGMGIDELSMAAGSVPKAKELVRKMDMDFAKRVWEEARVLSTAGEVREFLEGKLRELETT